VPLPANPLAYNGTGPLHISHPNFAQIFASYIDGAMEESGIPFQQDFISGHLLGRQYAPLTIAYPEEERSSSQTAFLRAALHSGRTNLKVYANMLAKRIVFNDTKTAMGVEVSGMLSEEHFINLVNFLLSDRSKRLLMAIQKLLF
jgi:choline dehydrogenase